MKIFISLSRQAPFTGKTNKKLAGGYQVLEGTGASHGKWALQQHGVIVIVGTLAEINSTYDSMYY